MCDINFVRPKGSAQALACVGDVRKCQHTLRAQSGLTLGTPQDFLPASDLINSRCTMAYTAIYLQEEVSKSTTEDRRFVLSHLATKNNLQQVWRRFHCHHFGCRSVRLLLTLCTTARPCRLLCASRCLYIGQCLSIVGKTEERTHGILCGSTAGQHGEGQHCPFLVLPERAM
nr:uncharacterized protein LOC129381395 isoform X1 [Dermacentor andersoni]